MKERAFLWISFFLSLRISGAIPFVNNEKEGTLHVFLEGKEAFVYRYGADLDLVHYWPLRSPSGRSMTVQYPKIYPHHRSFWFADTVSLAGNRKASFYNAFYTREKSNKGFGFRDHIRHVRFLQLESKGGILKIVSLILWEMDWRKPVLEEYRDLRVRSLGNGEYFMDLAFVLKASYGDVTFLSDAVHYAWPYIRLNDTYNVQNGGKIVNSEGGLNQKGTNGKVARWVDYTNSVDGCVEGVAIFSHPSNPHPHRWLTRDYGCFGPRRTDERSGRPFTLKRGEKLVQRVGILVHRGDTKKGDVAEKYKLYCEGRL